MKMKFIKRLNLILIAVLVVFISVVPVNAMSSRLKIDLTDSEKAFVENCGTVTVALSPDNFPYSKADNGQITGIYPEILNIVAYETGLKFEILPCESYSDYSRLKKDRKADVILATHVSPKQGSQLGYKLTDSYMVATYSKIELRENLAESEKVATLIEPSGEATEAAKYYYSDQIMYLDSMEECLSALVSHKCEAVITNTYNAEDIQYSDVKNQYVVKELYDNTLEISAGVRNDKSQILYDILNKALNSIDDATKQEIINRNTRQAERHTALVEMLYTNPSLFISVIISVFFLIFAIIFIISSYKKVKMKKMQADRYKKFIGYICNAVDSIIEVDLNNKVTTSYSSEDGNLIISKNLLPDDILSLVHEGDRDALKDVISINALKELSAREGVVYFEARMRWNKSPIYRRYTCILQGISPSKGRTQEILLILKDTENLRIEEERQRQILEDALEVAKSASESKGIFLSKMSHEIRTPLNAVIGYLAIAKDSDRDVDQILHYVDNSEIAAKHLLHIINDVLDISSIESGKMKIAYDDFDLKSSITDISTVFYQNAKAKGVRFEVCIDALSEEWVVGDSLRLNQILMNLLSNAIKFTPEEGLVKLEIKQINQDDKKVYIQFIVSDTGIGMSDEYMSRLFKPFEQESARTAQKYGGTGLGLSITYNLINMMGGTINVQSKQDEGSKFIITMHFTKSEKQAEKASKVMDYSHVRALIVDDEKADGQYIKAMLKRCGVKADTVTSGERAIKRLRGRKDSEYPYDLCILDWNMPEMDGIETAAKIRNEFGKELPIIIATAYDVNSIDKAAMNAGVNKVIAKPLFQSTLFDLLVSTFGKYSPDEKAEEVQKSIDLSGIKVLLAEDNAMNMDIALTVLKKVGVDVDCAVNGQEAYDKFLDAPEHTYNLILMDVQMPVLNGYEATRKIRNCGHAGAKDIPIIAMTANAFAEDVAEALANGMNEHISKPINYDKLFETLKKYSK